MELSFSSIIWLYHGTSAWHFITVPKGESKLIFEYFSTLRKPFGSLPVQVTIESITWNTSLFWDTKYQAFLLPVKLEIRKKSGLIAGMQPNITLIIL